MIEKNNTYLAALEAELTQNRLKLADICSTYTEQNPNVVDAKERASRSEQMYKEGLKDYVRSLRDSKSNEL